MYIVILMECCYRQGNLRKYFQFCPVFIKMNEFMLYIMQTKRFCLLKMGLNRDYFARLSCLYKNCKNWSEQFHFFILQSKFLVSKKINIWPSSKFELDWANNSNDFDGNKTFYWSRSIQKRFLLPKVEVSCFQKYEKLT